MKTFGEKVLDRRHQPRSAWNLQPAPAQEGLAPSFLIEQSLEGLHLRFELEDLDKLSLRLRQIELHAVNPLPVVEVERLRRQANAFTRRSWLGDKIELIELDEHSGKAQLRSHPPLREKDRISYFEIRLDGHHSLSLCRYSAARGFASREVCAFGITLEVFERLLTDMAAALNIT
jgi:hypothetical protein